MLSFRRSQRPAIHRTQLLATRPKPSCCNAGIPSTRSVKPFRGGRRTTMLRRCGTMGRQTSESARSGSLQDQVLEGCAAAVSDPFRPGCFASLSLLMLSFRRSQRPAIHRTQLQAELGPKSSCRSAGIPSTRSVKPFRGGRLTTMLRRCGTMGRLTSESARSGSLQDQVLEGCAAAVSDPI
jgi:hypothetical protein